MKSIQQELSSGAGDLASGKRKLQRKIRRARLSMLWEQLWPAIYLPTLIGAFYVSLSWLGLFGILDFWFRVPIVAIIAIGFVVSFYRFSLVQYPSYDAGLRRVEEDSGHVHRPFSALEDKLESGKNDPVGRELWQVHIKRMSEALKRVNTRYPQPNAFRRDPWGLRIAVILLFIIGFSISEGERGIRLLDAIAGPESKALVAGRIDAWVNPPAYTGRVPIFLTGDSSVALNFDKPILVPEGSDVIIRSQGYVGDLSILHGNSSESLYPVFNSVEADDNVNQDNLPVEHEIKLSESGLVEIRDGFETKHAWTFNIDPDLDPVISFEEEPERQISGALGLIYKITDDYGVVSADANFEADPEAPEQFGFKYEDYEVRPLVQPPSINLTLPNRNLEEPIAETVRNLTEHPWAGSNVILTLSAEDELGQIGYTEPYKMTLPSRFFRKPLARAIIEQRKILALDANQQTNVIDAFDAILLAPDLFLTDDKYFLGMNFVYDRLVAATTDEELIEVVELFWELALTIEDGDLSVAERALRDAQEALRNALQEGASDEEISRLTQELREALQKYMQAMVQQMRQNPQVMMPIDPSAQSFNSQDLDEMLRQIEELAKSGAREAAEQLLAQMQQMLENAQAAQSQMMQPNEGMRMMMEALNEIGQMIQQQQELMDQTFQLGQPNQQDGIQQFQFDENGQLVPVPQQNPNQPLDQAAMQQFLESLQNLQQQQGALEQQLQELMQRMQENGLPSNESLGNAGNAMNFAEQLLGRSDTGNAVGQQGQALDSLRQGVQELGEQMRNGGNRGGGMRMGGRRQDPLGRSQNNSGPDFGRHVKVPEEIDVQRARQILEELRRRFSDTKRPTIELDYLERLLNPF